MAGKIGAVVTTEELEKMKAARWHRKPDFELSDEMEKKMREVAEANSAATSMDEGPEDML